LFVLISIFGMHNEIFCILFIYFQIII